MCYYTARSAANGHLFPLGGRSLPQVTAKDLWRVSAQAGVFFLAHACLLTLGADAPASLLHASLCLSSVLIRRSTAVAVRGLLAGSPPRERATHHFPNICVCIYIYIYIVYHDMYIYLSLTLSLSLYIYIYTYIYIYIYTHDYMYMYVHIYIYIYI